METGAMGRFDRSDPLRVILRQRIKMSGFRWTECRPGQLKDRKE